jgi:hypothetical protein
MSTATIPIARVVEMSSDEYHADKLRVSRSMKVDFLGSPFTYFMRHIKQDPEWQQEVTPDMQFGTMFHGVALEGKKLSQLIKIIPEHVLNASGERKGGDYKEWESIHPDAKEWSRPKDVEPIQCTLDAMLASLVASSAANEKLQAPGHPGLKGLDPHEVTIHWTHNGIECRTRIDRLNSDCIIDLKSVRCADLHTINNTLEDAGYYLQAADYQMAVEEFTGEQLPFVFVFVEKAKPHRTVVVPIDQNWIDQGRAELDSGMARLQRCADTGDWHDPIADAPIPMSRPLWAKYKWSLVESE